MKSKRLVIVLAAAGMFCWMAVFGLGLLVSSQPYRDELKMAVQWWTLTKSVVTFTPTNVAILSILSGFLGGCSSLLLYWDLKGAAPPVNSNAAPIGESTAIEPPSAEEERLTFLTENPVSSALRGFVVFLTFLAGIVLGSNQAFTTTTQDQYCRMAGSVAILAFVMGYDPTIFKHFISMVPKKGAN